MSQQEKTLYKIYNTIRDCNISLFLVSSDWIAHNAVAAVIFSQWEERIKALPLKTVFACVLIQKLNIKHLLCFNLFISIYNLRMKKKKRTIKKDINNSKLKQ